MFRLAGSRDGGALLGAVRNSENIGFWLVVCMFFLCFSKGSFGGFIMFCRISSVFPKFFFFFSKRRIVFLGLLGFLVIDLCRVSRMCLSLF